MKNTLFPLLLLGVLMLFSCEKENLNADENDLATRSEVETRSLDDPDGIAFFAQGKTSNAESPEDPGDCLSQGYPFVDQQGKGVIPTYGPMAIRFTFCVDPSTVNEGFINYFNAKATFTLANGDELYAEG